MKRPYTPAQILANLRIFSDNLTKPPARTERAWMRWVIADILARNSTLEDAETETKAN